eukprot:1179864-Prorocentrum_minimum.AAC.4
MPPQGAAAPNVPPLQGAAAPNVPPLQGAAAPNVPPLQGAATPNVPPLASTAQVVDSIRHVLTVKDFAKSAVSLVPGDRNPFFIWAEGVRRHTWKDPTCGNGICEPPFEFPAYET